MEAVRALIASAALASILLLALFVTTGSHFASKIARLVPANGSAAAHRVASIVVETDKKGRCEERRFDNRSGKIVSATLVDC